MLENFNSRPAIAARARMGLAAVEESLVVAGQGDKARIRDLYRDLANDPSGIYKEQAEARLKDLDLRLTRIEIVEAPPPEPQPPPDLDTGLTPESQPAGATLPSAEPTLTVPIETNAPATAPASDAAPETAPQ
jgi:hypothetical protein